MDCARADEGKSPPGPNVAGGREASVAAGDISVAVGERGVGDEVSQAFETGRVCEQKR